MSRTILLQAVVVLGFVVAASTARPAQGQEALSAFMQAKLRHAEKTLEGLAKEDYDLIVQHSQAISLLCVDEQWMVLQTAEYKQRSDEFRRTVNAITDAARKKNLDAAALAYVDATMKCISCHKYVRTAKEGR